jgi:hypothetical protein
MKASDLFLKCLEAEGAKYGIEDYLEIKYLCVAGIEETS